MTWRVIFLALVMSGAGASSAEARLFDQVLAILKDQWEQVHRFSQNDPAGDLPKNRSWTLRERLSVLQGVLYHHPGLVSDNISFQRNLLEVLDPVGELRATLNRESVLEEAQESSRISGRYLAGNYSYDQARLKEVRNQLLADLSKLKLIELKGLREDIAALKQAVKPGVGQKPDPRAYEAGLKRLFRLAGVLYDANGKPIHHKLDQGARSVIEENIKSLGPGTLDNLFKDFLPQHIEPIVKAASGETSLASQVFRGISQNFVEKTVLPAITPIREGGNSATPRSLTLESIPSTTALYRGCKGGDCSILSVPYYPLVKDTKTYWIRKNGAFDSQPDGYVFVAPVEVDGKKLPYIITVNGPALAADDVRATVGMIAHDWGVDEVILADHKDDLGLVNTAEAVRGLTFKGAKDVTVRRPPGWEVVEEYLASHRSGYKNYYHWNALKNAKRVQISQESTSLYGKVTKEIAPSRYRPVRDLTRLKVYERAVIAAQMESQGLGEVERWRVRRALEVTQNQVDAVKPILSTGRGHSLTVDEFLKAKKHVGFDLQSLLDLDLRNRTKALSDIYQARPDLATHEEWKSLFNKVSESIGQSVETLDYFHTQPRDISQTWENAVRFRSLIPAEFRTDDLRGIRAGFDVARDPEQRLRLSVLRKMIDYRFLSVQKETLSATREAATAVHIRALEQIAANAADFNFSLDYNFSLDDNRTKDALEQLDWFKKTIPFNEQPKTMNALSFSIASSAHLGTGGNNLEAQKLLQEMDLWKDQGKRVLNWIEQLPPIVQEKARNWLVTKQPGLEEVERYLLDHNSFGVRGELVSVKNSKTMVRLAKIVVGEIDDPKISKEEASRLLRKSSVRQDSEASAILKKGLDNSDPERSRLSARLLMSALGAHGIDPKVEARYIEGIWTDSWQRANSDVIRPKTPEGEVAMARLLGSELSNGDYQNPVYLTDLVKDRLKSLENPSPQLRAELERLVDHSTMPGQRAAVASFLLDMGEPHTPRLYTAILSSTEGRNYLGYLKKEHINEPKVIAALVNRLNFKNDTGYVEQLLKELLPDSVPRYHAELEKVLRTGTPIGRLRAAVSLINHGRNIAEAELALASLIHAQDVNESYILKFFGWHPPSSAAARLELLKTSGENISQVGHAELFERQREVLKAMLAERQIPLGTHQALDLVISEARSHSNYRGTDEILSLASELMRLPEQKEHGFVEDHLKKDLTEAICGARTHHSH